MRHTITPRTKLAESFLRPLTIGVISFLTLVDLFAAQAILPALAASYKVSPAAMAFAVNASTFGMAAAGIVIALLSQRIDQRKGIILSLTLLAVPTLLLALKPSLPVFTALRVAQGVCMSSAFTLTMAYLAEHSCPNRLAGALAAYVTGNVASNLFGRFMSAAVADHYGLGANFLVLAGLNLTGAILVFAALERVGAMMEVRSAGMGGMSKGSAWLDHLKNPALAAAFGTGFLILFAFIGTFTYVNFVLVREPLSLNQMEVGFVYFVFAPSIMLTPFAGRLASGVGPVLAIRIAFAIALAALPLLLVPSLSAVLLGLAFVAIGTFGAQAIATGFVSRLASTNRGAASGLYLASYYLGGLAGTFALGRIFDAWGWTVTVFAIGASLAAALALTARLAPRPMAMPNAIPNLQS
jgi:MFS transporter, YNFM family, putative membrane transport protein